MKAIIRLNLGLMGAQHGVVAAAQHLAHLRLDNTFLFGHGHLGSTWHGMGQGVSHCNSISQIHLSVRLAHDQVW